MSDTPRTDKQTLMVSQLAPQTQTVPAELCRTLERELAAAQKDAERLNWFDTLAEHKLARIRADVMEGKSVREAIDRWK